MRTEFLLESMKNKAYPGRPGRSCDGSIKKYLRETGLLGVDLIHLARDRDRLSGLVNAVGPLNFTVC